MSSFSLPAQLQSFGVRSQFLALIVLLIWSASSTLVPSLASGQTPDQPVPGYVMKHWTTAEGLPHNSISALRQTGDGFIWVGTSNAGLVRFDGVAFQTFNLANTPALLSNRIAVLHEDSDGTLWVGTGAGLVRYRDRAFTSERLDDIPSHNVIVDVRSDIDGRLWVAAEGGVFRRDGERWIAIPTEGSVVQGLAMSPNRTVWIATRAGLIEWRERVIRTITSRDGLPDDWVFDAYEDRAGRVWIGTLHGLAYLDVSSGQITVERGVRPELSIHAFLEDARGLLWIGASGGLVTRTVEGVITYSEFATGSDTEPGLVTAITEDRDGHVWVGTERHRGGLYRLTGERVTTLGRQEGLPCDNVGPVTQAADGTIWLATLCDDGRGVFASRDGQLTPYAGPSRVESLLVEPDESIWVGTFLGALFHLEGERFVEVPTPAREQGDEIATLYRHTDGALWLGTSRGLLRWHAGQWTRLQASDGLASNDVRSITRDRDGVMWIGMDGGISRLHEGKVTSYRVEDGVPPGPVRAIHVDADGVIWIGTYGGGLARFKDGVFTNYGVRDGVLDSSVHRILEDDDGFLWLTGDLGIRRASKQDLNAIADGYAVSFNVTLYDEEDGMRSAECNGMAQPAGWRMRDGTFHFATQRGVVRIDPAGAAPSGTLTPLPQIEDAIVDGASSPLGPEVVVPAGYRDLEIRYTAPAYARPEQVQFKYRLDGYNADWVDVGTRRIASYANLRPGRYRFLVTARTSGGPWSNQPAVVALVLQPYFYQRLGFQLALVMLGLVLGTAIARWYIKSLHRRADQLEEAVAARTADLSVAHKTLLEATHVVEQAHGQMLAVFNQLDIGVLVLTAGGIVRHASAAAQRALHRDQQALVGRPWSVCLPLVEADRIEMKARVETRSPSERRLPVQMVIGGKRYWAEIDVRDEPPPGDGRILYIYSVTEMSTPPASGRADGLHGLVGRSTAMHLVYKQIRDVARVSSTVLIEGETGVGKELVARAIHRGSQRADKPFVAVNAAGLSESLLASQLFGHRRGAFTGAVDDQMGVFEAADGGTLFLDEIGDMPLSVQSSLLRVLQEREITRIGESHARRVSARFLAATHRDLTREVEEGRFRQDLLYRIRVATIVVPPLRARLDDVPLLIDAFLTQAANQAGGRPAPHMSREAVEALLRHKWPGNVRELKAVIEHSLVNAPGDLIRLEDLPPEVVNGRAPATPPTPVPAALQERERLVEALRRTGGNRSEAAKLLGIGRTTLYRRLAAHGLDQEP